LKGSQRQGLPDIKAINLSKLSRCWLRIIQKSNLLPGDEEIDWLLDESTGLRSKLVLTTMQYCWSVSCNSKSETKTIYAGFKIIFNCKMQNENFKFEIRNLHFAIDIPLLV
jgi:hypothetical protein